jgi:hypothetical protein
MNEMYRLVVCAAPKEYSMESVNGCTSLGVHRADCEIQTAY